MSLNNSTYTQSLGIPFTQYVTSSAGHALVSSSTYFNDTSDNVPRYKDANGNIIEPFVSSSYAVTASYALTAETPNAVITASNVGNDDTIEFLKGGGGTFAVTVNNVVSSSYALTASYALSSPGGTDTNFANTNLTLNGSRFHDLNGFDLTIAGGNAGIYLDEATNTSQVGQGSNYISVDNTGIILYHSLGSRMSFLAGTTVINEAGTSANLRVESDTNANMLLVDGGTNRVGIGKSAPNSVLDVNGDTTISGSLKVTNVTENASITNVALYDTVTDQFFYTSSAAIGGGGTDTNFANTDLTFTADRNHNSNGNNFVVSADGLGVTSSNAYLGYIFTPLMGSTTTSSYLGVGDTYVLATEGITVPTLDFTVEGTSSMYMIGNSSVGGVNIANDALFASTVTGNVSIGKNTNSGVQLDVNGNTIITGSLTVTGTVDADTGSFNYIQADGIIQRTGDTGTGLSFASDQVNIQGNTFTNAAFGTTLNTIGNSFLEQPLTVHGDSTFEDRIITTTTDNAITTAGTFNPTGGNRSYVTLSGSIAVTLADGVQGQLLHIYCRDITAAGTTTITPTNKAGFTSVAFDAVGETATLMFADGGGGQWYLLSSFGATVT